MKWTAIALSTILILAAAPASAGWLHNATNPFTGPQTGYYGEVVMVPSGKDVIVAGFILKTLPTTTLFIKLEKLDRCGDRQWSGAVANPGASGTGLHGGLAMIPDGSGGCVVAWHTQVFPGDVYAQRFDTNGNPLWALGGIPVAAIEENEGNPHMVPDGSGGAIIAFERGGDLYAQRVNATGATQWASGGVTLATDTSTIVLSGMVEGASGEAIVSYYQGGGGSVEHFAQKLSPSGTTAWTPGGVSMGSTVTTQADITIDGAGGAWLAMVALDGADKDVKTVHLNSGGTMVATHLHGGSEEHHTPSIAYVGNGNVDVAYVETPGGVHDDVHITRIGSGIGYTATFLPGNQEVADLVWDGYGGSVLVWRDSAGDGGDIYAQHFTGTTFKWLNLGQPICTASGIQEHPRVVLSPNAAHGVGDFFVGWNDGRNANPSAFIQRVDGKSGVWGHPEIKIQALYDCDGDDEGGCLGIEFIKSALDGPPYPIDPPAPIVKYSVWRAVDVLPMYPPDPIHSCVTPVAGTHGANVPCDGWEQVLEIPVGSISDPYYYAALPTTRDVAPGDDAMHFWVVMAHDSLDSTYVSEPDSGASTDDLAPWNPVEPVGEFRGNYVYLEWLPSPAPDVDHYNIYRIDGGISVHIGTTTNNGYTDDTVDPALSYDYQMTTTDDNGNEGPNSPIVSVGPNPTGVRPGGAAPGALTLMSASPNPFSDHASFRVGLPADAPVTVQIFDARGRRVHEEAHNNLGAGWHTLRLDARGNADLPSGVYFYRVKTHGDTAVRKVVIMR